jgi:hypothetical protein
MNLGYIISHEEKYDARCNANVPFPSVVLALVFAFLAFGAWSSSVEERFCGGSGGA